MTHLAVAIIIVMKISQLIATLLTPVSAWTSLSMMGSRAATKGSNREVWAEARGFSALGSTGGGDGDDSSPSVPFATIIGGGRIGSMLAENGECLLVKREGAIAADGTGPIFIATRNDSLEGIIDACPENRRKDLMFLQNGYLDGFLDSKGLADNSQCLLFVAVTAIGADPIDGITTVNPEGLTGATGEHAAALQARLNAAGMKCNILTAETYKPAMFEKLMWISTYMLVGAAKECSSVGQAGGEHGDLVEQVINELVNAVTAKEGVTFPDGTVERLKAYTDVVASFPCAVKEFEWRNKYFYDLGDDACPVHNGLLRECAEKGLLSFELP